MYNASVQIENAYLDCARSHHGQFIARRHYFIRSIRRLRTPYVSLGSSLSNKQPGTHNQRKPVAWLRLLGSCPSNYLTSIKRCQHEIMQLIIPYRRISPSLTSLRSPYRILQCPYVRLEPYDCRNGLHSAGYSAQYRNQSVQPSSKALLVVNGYPDSRALPAFLCNTASLKRVNDQQERVLACFSACTECSSCLWIRFS